MVLSQWINITYNNFIK